MLHGIISKRFPVFPQSVQEVFYGCLIGFSFSYVLIVPLSFPTLTVIFIICILLKRRDENV
jgi:hypothetical protein